VSTAVQVDPEVRSPTKPDPATRIVADGKFLRAGGARWLLKGVTYGTFAPDAEGSQFPSRQQIAEDFRLMAGLGINTVRTYTAPRIDLLDEAARNGLRVMVGLPWSQHVAFLDDRRLSRQIRHDIAQKVADLSSHPAVVMFALGNEIPAGVVRWHGRLRVERFLRSLYDTAKSAAPDTLCTYVNFPPSFSISRSSTSARSTSICTVNRNCAPISHGFSTSPVINRCCSPRRARTASARGNRRRHC